MSRVIAPRRQRPPRWRISSRSPCPSSGCERSTPRCAPPPTSSVKPEKTLRRHQPLPVNLLALLGPLRCPELGYLLGERLLRLAHHLYDAQAQDLLGPLLLAPSLVAGLYPQMLQPREPGPRRLQQSSLNPSWSGTLALCTLAFKTNPSVSTRAGGVFCLALSLRGQSRAQCLPLPWSLATESPRSLRLGSASCQGEIAAARAARRSAAPKSRRASIA
jgi:hypothetical protein